MLTAIFNGTAALVAAASIRQDTATIRVPGHGEVLDSTVDHMLLPDTITPIVQWIFQKPPWLMWTGAILAAVLALGALWWLRGHIKAVVRFLATRSGLVKAALVGCGAAARGRRSRGRHEVLRLHDERQAHVQRLPRLRAQRPGDRAARHRRLHPGQQARGQARHAELPCLPCLQCPQGSGEDGAVDVGCSRLDHPEARHGAAQRVRAVPQAGGGEGNLAGYRQDRRPPHPPRVGQFGTHRARWSA